MLERMPLLIVNGNQIEVMRVPKCGFCAVAQRPKGVDPAEWAADAHELCKAWNIYVGFDERKRKEILAALEDVVSKPVGARIG